MTLRLFHLWEDTQKTISFQDDLQNLHYLQDEPYCTQLNSHRMTLKAGSF